MVVFFHNDTDRMISEQRYRALVENALDGITLIDADFMPLYRSPANSRILGHHQDPDGLLTPLPYHPDDLPEVRKQVEALAPDEAVTLEFRARHQDGHWRWIRATFTNRLDDPAVQATVINFSDITEKRQLREEAEIRQAELLESHRAQQLRLTRLETLHRVHLAATAYEDLTASMRAILSSAIRDVPAVAYAYMEDSGELQAVAHYGLTVAAAALSDESVRELAQRTLDAGTVVTLEFESGSAAGLEADFADAGFRGGHVVPFERDGARGTVMILTQTPAQSDAEAVSYLSTLTGYIASAVATGRLLEELERSAHDYGALAAFGHRIETIHDIDELVTTGLRELLAHLAMDNAALAEIVGDVAVPRWRDGSSPLESDERLMQPIPLERGAIADAISTGEPVLVSDYRRYEDRPEHLDSVGFTSVLALPIEADAGHYVFILASRNEKHEIDETDVAIATLFARRLGNAFERVAHLDEVKATREATFRALGLALEYRDYETKGHTDRVVNLAARFGKELGFDDDELQALQWGAYLHDLGKLSVPDQVLLKPGKLTAEEFELIKRHPVIGEELCRDIPFLPDAARDVVLHHHERWDGTGYPHGLVAHDIPLEARMFALVDVYDALTCDRPYRAAWDKGTALKYLTDQASTEFDPELVERFLKIMTD